MTQQFEVCFAGASGTLTCASVFTFARAGLGSPFASAYRVAQANQLRQGDVVKWQGRDCTIASVKQLPREGNCNA